MPDWTTGRYVRVFASLQTDYPEVWADDALLAWYVRLLDQADALWPSQAPWPRSLPTEVEVRLISLGAIDRRGMDAYLVSGLDRLRVETASRGWAGGKARAAVARRDGLGRMLAGDAGPGAGPMNGNAGGHAGPDAGDDAGEGTLEGPLDVQRSSDQTRPDRSPGAPPTSGPQGSSSTTKRARDDDDTIHCDDYQAHRSEHRRVPGVGWVCLTCQKAEAARTPSLKERVGWTPSADPPRRADPPKALTTPVRDAIRDRLGYVPGEEVPPDDDSRPF